MFGKVYERADVHMADFDHLGDDEALVRRVVMSTGRGRYRGLEIGGGGEHIPFRRQ